MYSHFAIPAGILDSAQIETVFNFLGLAPPPWATNSTMINLLALLRALIPTKVKKAGYCFALGVVAKQCLNAEQAAAFKKAHVACWDAYMTVTSFFNIVLACAGVMGIDLVDYVVPGHGQLPAPGNDGVGTAGTRRVKRAASDEAVKPKPIKKAKPFKAKQSKKGKANKAK
jgi:hypothetical protein